MKKLGSIFLEVKMKAHEIQPTSNEDSFVQSIINFSKESMLLCANESEKAVGVVGTILDIIAQDAVRVSKVSEDTLIALSGLRDKFNFNARSDEKENLSLSSLISALKKINTENSDIFSFIGPIIENLQFQDRIRQQMENLSKMMEAWDEMRSSGNFSNEKYPDFLVEFGTRLLKITKSPEERPIIHSQIPNLPELENISAAEDDFFF